jgi:hypothetical protein
LWLILTVPSFFIAYAVQPVPTMLMLKQVLFEGIDKIVLGVITAALYRPLRVVRITDAESEMAC